jgi:hypothetical protein
MRLNRIVKKFRRNGIAVIVIGANRASATMIEKYATHDKQSGPVHYEPSQEECTGRPARAKESEISLSLGRSE